MITRENTVGVGWRGATPKGLVDIADWMLVPSNLPQMEMKIQHFVTIRKAEGLRIPDNFPAEKVSLTIPPYSQVSFLLNQAVLTNAYPILIFSKGNNTVISLTYTEA